MATLSPAVIGTSPTVAFPADDAPGVVALDRTEAFEQALARQTEGVSGVNGVNGVTDPTRVAGVDAPNSPEAVERTRRTLELDSSTRAGTPVGGDLILDGLKRLRGSFDQTQTRINEVMNDRAIGAQTLLEVQVELVRFSLLTDVTSKLTGKSTQAFDTLMKGQ